jgi:acetyl esterase
MPLHPQAATLLQLIEAFGDPKIEDSTPEQARAVRAGRQLPSTTVVHEVRDVDAGGVPARLYRPSTNDQLGLLVYFHGGGWVLGDIDSHDGVCRALANGSGHAVLSVDYRLAPEHPFPAPLEDCFTATRWAYEHAAQLGCRNDRIAVGGDSAGANLAAVVAQHPPAPLTYQLLVYPATDLTQAHPSYTTNGEGYFLSKAAMTWFINHYIGPDTSPTDPRVSPLFAADHVIAETPPALVITAEFDPLRDEGDAYAHKLKAAGVACSHVRFDGMFHGFFSLAEFIDDGSAANALAAAALAKALSR